MSLKHLPRQPTWTCIECAGIAPWPCEPAQTALLGAYRAERVKLAVAMSIYLFRAAGDLPLLGPTELYRRFVRWTRPVPLDADWALEATA